MRAQSVFLCAPLPGNVVKPSILFCLQMPIRPNQQAVRGGLQVHIAARHGGLLFVTDAHGSPCRWSTRYHHGLTISRPQVLYLITRNFGGSAHAGVVAAFLMMFDLLNVRSLGHGHVSKLCITNGPADYRGSLGACRLTAHLLACFRRVDCPGM